MSEIAEKYLIQLQQFFARDVAKKGMHPLRDGIEIGIWVDEKGPATLTKKGGVPTILNQAPKKPDMIFWFTAGAMQTLLDTKTDEVGDIGVAILQLLAHSDDSQRVKAKVNIGLFDLLRNGYLGVIPLGGPSVMKFLASKGFTGMGKIKDAISRFRE